MGNTNCVKIQEESQNYIKIRNRIYFNDIYVDYLNTEKNWYKREVEELKGKAQKQVQELAQRLKLITDTKLALEKEPKQNEEQLQFAQAEADKMRQLFEEKEKENAVLLQQLDESQKTITALLETLKKSKEKNDFFKKQIKELLESSKNRRDTSKGPKEITQIEDISKSIEEIEEKINNFSGGRNDKDFLHLDESLIRILVTLDDLEVENDPKMRETRKFLIEHVYQLRQLLESKCID